MKKKKLILIILACIVALAVLTLAGMRLIGGKGLIIRTFFNIDVTDQMKAETYSDPAGKGTIPYRIYVPDGISPDKKLPLVVYLHGSSGSGNDNKKHMVRNSIMQVLLNDENLKKYPCVVIAPQCPEESRWYEDDISNLVYGLIKQTMSAYPIDESRVYVTGVSMGGSGTWDMAARHPDLFAAAVPICGYAEFEDAPKLKDMPIWTFHGRLDRTSDPQRTRDMVKAIQKAGSTRIKYTEYKWENHACWEVAYRDPALLKWMFEQKK